MMLSRSEVDFWGHLKSDSASLGARKTSLKELLGLAENHSALIQGLGRRAESSEPPSHPRMQAPPCLGRAAPNHHLHSEPTTPGLLSATLRRGRRHRFRLQGPVAPPPLSMDAWSQGREFSSKDSSRSQLSLKMTKCWAPRPGT